MGGMGCGAEANRSFRTVRGAPRTVPFPALSAMRDVADMRALRGEPLAVNLSNARFAMDL